MKRTCLHQRARQKAIFNFCYEQLDRFNNAKNKFVLLKQPSLLEQWSKEIDTWPTRKGECEAGLQSWQSWSISLLTREACKAFIGKEGRRETNPISVVSKVFENKLELNSLFFPGLVNKGWFRKTEICYEIIKTKSESKYIFKELQLCQMSYHTFCKNLSNTKDSGKVGKLRQLKKRTN